LVVLTLACPNQWLMMRRSVLHPVLRTRESVELFDGDLQVEGGQGARTGLLCPRVRLNWLDLH